VGGARDFIGVGHFGHPIRQPVTKLSFDPSHRYATGCTGPSVGRDANEGDQEIVDEPGGTKSESYNSGEDV